METVVIEELEGEVFPAGRRSRIVAGPSGLPAERFALGHSTVFPGGSIPLHSHGNEEIYVILAGTGQMQVGEERREVRPTTAIYIPSGIEHSLVNTGEEDLVVQWVYAPGGVVDHWAEERNEGLPDAWEGDER